MLNAHEVAKLFHENYERLAPQFGYETREASSLPWEDVPERNKQLMIATCREVMRVIKREGIDGV